MLLLRKSTPEIAKTIRRENKHYRKKALTNRPLKYIRRNIIMGTCIKISILTTALLVISSVACTAQGDISLGVIGGLNISDASTSPSFSTASINVPLFGAVIERKISNNFYLEADVYYIQKGAEWKIAPVKTKFEYFELALLFKLKFGTPIIKPVILGGLTLGAPLSAKLETTIGNQTQTIDYKQFTEPLDGSLDIGAGLEFPTGPMLSIFANARYSLGIIDVDKTTLGWKNNGIHLVAGMLIGL
jgi:hypothetical protein